jgi:hypothetical protein
MLKLGNNAPRFLPPLMALLLLAASTLARADETVVHFAYIGDTHTATYAGVNLGLHESNLQGKFLNYRFTLDNYPPSKAGTIKASNYVAILTAIPTDKLHALATRIHDVPILNLTDKDDSLRKYCISNVFHIIQSDAMDRDAVAQWKKKHPGSRVKATAWDPRFVKYAGRDLNKRYTARYQKKMDEMAWAGWVGARMIGDVIVRGTAPKPARVMTYLKTKLAFDGQKGLDMTFRKTGQLRQPLLFVENGKLLNAQAPVRGVVDPEDYDSLGVKHCSE